MGNRYFKQEAAQESEDESVVGLFAYLAGVIAILCFLSAAGAGLSYKKHANYYEQSQATQGVLIERIRLQKNRNQTKFYLLGLQELLYSRLFYNQNY